MTTGKSSHGQAAWARCEGTDQPALGVGAADTRHAFEIVASRRESITELLDTLKTVPAVGGGVLLIVLGTEVAEVPLEYGMELLAAAGNVLIPRRSRDRDCRTYIIAYERNQLFASDRELVPRSPHNIAHSPGAFSSLRSCEGAGDAYVMPLRPVNDLPMLAK